MEDFVIHRAQPRAGVPERESRMMELLRSINSNTFLKKLTQLRHEFNDCDFDSEINACKLYYMQGERDKVLAILEEIRRKLSKYGENLLLKRMQNDEDLGVLGRLPEDVMRLMLN